MDIFNRILSDIFLFLAILVLPWWFALILGLAFFFNFNNYIELVIAGLIFDSLYGMTNSDAKPIWFIIFAILYIILNIFRRYLRSNG